MREVYGGAHARKRAKVEARRYLMLCVWEVAGWVAVMAMVTATFYKFFVE
jgi:hypothetical protein